jgi:hypothetical protein
MAAALLSIVFGLGFLLGYVVREIISQRRERRALMQLRQYGVDDLQPGRRVVDLDGDGTSPTSPPLSPSEAEKAMRSPKQPSSSAGAAER